MKKRCTLSMVFYELRNINGNFMPHFFGIIFPNLMCLLLVQAIGGEMPKEIHREVATSVMLTMTLVIPSSIMLMGYGALYANEVERGIPLRMSLFGYGGGCEIMAKIIVHLIFLTLAFGVFGIFQAAVMRVQKPALASFLCLFVSLYLVGILFLALAHAIACIFQRFSVAFGITMFLYFIMMILTGMMGISTDQLPQALQKIARLFPMTYISSDFIDFWQGGSYNFMPFIQSFLFLGAVTGILLLFSRHKIRRTVTRRVQA